MGRTRDAESRWGPVREEVPVVLTLGEQDVWQCARCGRGSPDIRDEAAHLDAHRRLERDRTVVTWEVLAHRLTRPEPESSDRNRRRAPLLVSAVAALLLGSLLLSIRTSEDPRGRAEEIPTPAPVPEAAVPAPPTTVTPSTAGETPLGPPPLSVPPANVETGPPSTSPPAVSQPLTAGPAPPTPTPAQPVDQPHLLELCLPPVLCLAV